MQQQTEAEVLVVGKEWFRSFAPQDLLDNEANGTALFEYIMTFLGGLVTIPNLVFAEQALRAEGKLQLVAPKSADEIQVEAIKAQEDKWRKQHYHSLRENQVERNFAAEAEAKKVADARAKEAADADATIKLVISNYKANHPRLANIIDYARTQQVQADLRKVKVYKSGKYDAVETLKAIREIISKLP